MFPVSIHALLFCSEARTCDGCVRFTNSDLNNAMTLPIPSIMLLGDDNSADTCVLACQKAGFSIAGMEYAGQCCACFTWSL